MESTFTANHDLRYYIRRLAYCVAIAMSVFQLYSALFGSFATMELRAGHLSFVLALIFLYKIVKKEGPIGLDDLGHFFLACVSVYICMYAFFNWEVLTMEVAFPSEMQIIQGTILVLLVIFATQRALGWAIPIVCMIFLAYAMFGQYIPVAGHRGYPFDRIIGNMYMVTEGVFGSVLGVSATYIFLFILFGTFLEKSGASEFFMSLAMSFFGKLRGGPAKVSIVASGLLGTISGSAVANVCTTGVMTIPLMNRVGYSKVFAGAVESVASTGGQIMPPVMGAAAFIMAEALGIPYVAVCKAAIIPAIMYYLALWFMIDLHAQKTDIKPLPKEEIPDWKPILRGGFYLALPVVLLIYFLAVMGWSPLKSGLWSIGALLIVSSIRKKNRFTLKSMGDALAASAEGALSVAAVCASAGIIIGVLNLTGLGIKFSQLLIMLSFGSKPLLLILTMVAGLILGMGMTATSVYIILSVLIAPALVEMGVIAIAAHLFAFYFGILSAITPPVAVASFAAASLANESPNKVGTQAFLLGIAGFIVPFMFLYNPVLLLEGDWHELFYGIGTSFIGIFCLAASVEGFFVQRLKIWWRILLFAAAIGLIDKGFETDLFGFSVLAVTYIVHKVGKKKNLSTPAT